MANARKVELKLLPNTIAIPDGVPAEAREKFQGDTLDYRKTIRAQLERAGTQGRTIADIRWRLEALRTLEAADRFWVIETEAHKKILDELKSEKWAAVSPNLVQFFDDFESAPEVPYELTAIQ